MLLKEREMGWSAEGTMFYDKWAMGWPAEGTALEKLKNEKELWERMRRKNVDWTEESGMCD